MQLLDVLHPLLDLVGVAVSPLDRAHGHVSVLQLLGLGTQLQLEHGGVGLVGRGLVEEPQPQAVLQVVGSRHLISQCVWR